VQVAVALLQFDIQSTINSGVLFFIVYHYNLILLEIIIMTIKKAFVELVELLEANKDKKVSSILSEVLAMAESKKRDSTVLKDDDGNVIAIFCYYHKQWELLSEVEYGAKKNSASGYNTMCKVGVSKWTKQQSLAKKAKEQVLDDVSKGEIDPSDIKAKLQEVEEARQVVDTTDMPNGYANEEDIPA